MARQVISQSLIDTPVEQNPHSGFGREKLLGFFKGGDSHLARNARESFEKFLERFPAFEGVEQCLEGNTRPAKHRRPTKNFRVFDDNAVPRIHGVLHCGQYSIPSWRSSGAPAGHGREQRRSPVSRQERRVSTVVSHLPLRSTRLEKKARVISPTHNLKALLREAPSCALRLGHLRFNQADNGHHDSAPNPSTSNAGKNGRHV